MKLKRKKKKQENYDVLHVYHFAVTYFIAFFFIFIAPFPCKIENIVLNTIRYEISFHPVVYSFFFSFRLFGLVIVKSLNCYTEWFVSFIHHLFIIVEKIKIKI